MIQQFISLNILDGGQSKKISNFKNIRERKQQ